MIFHRLQCMRPRTIALAIVLAALLAPAGLAAQQRDTIRGRRPAATDTAAARRAAQQALGRDVSQADIIERLRQSGLSRAQVRARLQQAGYDPTLADRYFDMLEGRVPVDSTARSGGFATALSRIGLGVRTGLDSLDLATDTLPSDSSAATSKVFGRSLFTRAAGSQFDPVVTGPVDPGYRLGPGDQIGLVLSGDIEEAYTLDVTREGIVFIPDIGQINVNGLTLGGLEDVLYQRLARVYSGVTRGANATTRFHLTLGSLRTNQVFVIGEVERPGGYQISSVARVLNALYQAGGPTENGSFRRIEIHRGDRVVAQLDLYDYLLRGDARGDIRLEQNDRIFIPAAGPQVTMTGAVMRPAIFEMRPGETLTDALRFAGGLRPNAVVRRIQIDRILPASQRRPGVVRVVVDVDPATVVPGSPGAALQNGDVVRVFAVSEDIRNRLAVEGQVNNPGTYEWRPGMTLWSLIDRADGLEEQAYTPLAHIFRLNPADQTRRLVKTGLLADSAGRPLSDMALEDRDSVVIYSRAELSNRQTVEISGYVKNPGRYTFVEGGTPRDLILRAGGFLPGANLADAEVYRLPNPLVRNDTLALRLNVRLAAPEGVDRALVIEGGMPDLWSSEAVSTRLEPGDRIFIRRAPGYQMAGAVRITGEVTHPGAYVLPSRTERFADLVTRAGGITAEAYPDGIRVIREGRLVAADLARALRDRDDRNNILLEDGDSIAVPKYDPTVVVMGAVAFEAGVLFDRKHDLNWYLDQAGGTTVDADRSRITVTYPNGQRASVRKLFGVRRTPDVLPGSIITVPAKPADRTGTNWDQILSRTIAALSTVLTLVLVVQQSKT